ncbi:MAG: hypothetical protein HYY46_00980 [Deltaproteobacteria bacterium]|nr:hypothetical protein [Deltaproteobacteria bacterium]
MKFEPAYLELFSTGEPKRLIVTRTPSICARLSPSDETIEVGQQVIISGVSDLQLKVKRA